MKIVLLHGQNHKGSTYHVAHRIIEKIAGEKEITEFFFPRDLDRFCAGCYRCIEDAAACRFMRKRRSFWTPSTKPIFLS